MHALSQALQISALLALVFGLSLIMSVTGSWSLLLAFILDLSILGYKALVLAIFEESFAIEARNDTIMGQMVLVLSRWRTITLPEGATQSVSSTTKERAVVEYRTSITLNE